MLLSISIPTYFMPPNGGADFLDYSLERIYNQSYNKDNIEIVISDHCLDNTIENVADRWADKLHIRYFKKDYNRDSASDNLRNSGDPRFSIATETRNRVLSRSMPAPA